MVARERKLLSIQSTELLKMREILLRSVQVHLDRSDPRQRIMINKMVKIHRGASHLTSSMENKDQSMEINKMNEILQPCDQVRTEQLDHLLMIIKGRYTEINRMKEILRQCDQVHMARLDHLLMIIKGQFTRMKEILQQYDQVHMAHLDHLTIIKDQLTEMHRPKDILVHKFQSEIHMEITEPMTIRE